MELNLIQQAADRREQLKNNIANSFNPLQQDTFEQLCKSEENQFDELEKAKRIRAVIGEKRTHGGREYIRTMNGWKYHGKGGGVKATEHRESSLSYHVESGKVKPTDDDYRDKGIHPPGTGGSSVYMSDEEVATHKEKTASTKTEATPAKEEVGSLKGKSVKDVRSMLMSDDFPNDMKVEVTWESGDKMKPTTVKQLRDYLYDQSNQNAPARLLKIEKQEQAKDDKEEVGSFNGDLELKKRLQEKKRADFDKKKAPKTMTFKEILANPEGKKLIEAIEHGTSDTAIINDLKDQLKSKFGYQYDETVSSKDTAKKDKFFEDQKGITSSKHISDMTFTEKKAAAKQLGIDPTGKSVVDLNKQLAGKNVDKALQEWQDGRKAASTDKLKMGSRSKEALPIAHSKAAGIVKKDGETGKKKVESKVDDQSTILDPKDAKKESGYFGFDKKDTPAQFESKIDKYLSLVSNSNRVQKLNDIEKYAKSARGVYDYSSDRMNKALLSVDKLREKHVQSFNSKLYGKDINIDKKGLIQIGKDKIQIDSSSGFVKIGGNGTATSSGAFYSPGHTDSQLQGVTYVASVNKFKNYLLDGLSQREIDQKMNEHKGPIHGEEPGVIWNKKVKPYLGLK